MQELARIKAYKPVENGTELIISLDKDVRYLIQDKKISSIEVRFDDGRCISAEQRKKAYATIKDIADYLGYLPEELKELMKYQHTEETGAEYLSLSDCTMTEAREFINTLIKFALEHDIPLSEVGTNRTDDIGRYLYYCIKTRHCAICGAPQSDIHHCEGSRIGMGQDRTKVDHSTRDLVCLCRKHHSILHTMPESDFLARYHIYGIKVEEVENEIRNQRNTQNEEE